MDHPAPHSIMVIGTDLHFCYLLQRYVRESDHPLLYTTPDDKALSLAQHEKPALIVIEAGNPETRSLEMLKLLKGNRNTCQIPIAFCSWRDNELSSNETGADICLRMPVLYSDFLAALDSLGI
jgi:DNA-binding response OmpR family regulator